MPPTCQEQKSKFQKPTLRALKRPFFMSKDLSRSFAIFIFLVFAKAEMLHFIFNFFQDCRLIVAGLYGLVMNCLIVDNQP